VNYITIGAMLANRVANLIIRQPRELVMHVANINRIIDVNPAPIALAPENLAVRHNTIFES
jgi:hypothetical protein